MASFPFALLNRPPGWAGMCILVYRRGGGGRCISSDKGGLHQRVVILQLADRDPSCHSSYRGFFLIIYPQSSADGADFWSPFGFVFNPFVLEPSLE